MSLSYERKSDSVAHQGTADRATDPLLVERQILGRKGIRAFSARRARKRKRAAVHVRACSRRDRHDCVRAWPYCASNWLRNTLNSCTASSRLLIVALPHTVS